MAVPELSGRRTNYSSDDGTWTLQQALNAWDRYTKREISTRSSTVDGAKGAPEDSPKVEFNLPPWLRVTVLKAAVERFKWEGVRRKPSEQQRIYNIYLYDLSYSGQLSRQRRKPCACETTPTKLDGRTGVGRLRSSGLAKGRRQARAAQGSLPKVQAPEPR